MDKKIKVGLFIDTFYPMVDGVVMVVDNYAKKLSENCDVTVFTVDSRDKTYVDNFPYKVVRCKTLKLPFLDYDLPTPKRDKEFKRILKESDLDIVHIHSPFSVSKMAVKYAKEKNIPCIATLHSQFKRDFKMATKSIILTKILLSITMSTFKRADVLWTMNNACIDLSREYGYKGKVELVSNGTDLVCLQDEIFKYNKEIIKKEYDIKDDEFILINIGRINKIKNLSFVIKVIKKLKDKGQKIKLLLVGSGGDEKYYRKMVKRLNLEKEIIFTGRVMELNKKSALLGIADLHIFPSFYDTDGIVRIEAAACETPTIFIEGSVASSTIKNGENGYIGENNIEKFADKICEIIEDKEKLLQISQEAKKQLYISWDNVLEDVFKRYQICIDKN